MKRPHLFQEKQPVFPLRSASIHTYNANFKVDYRRDTYHFEVAADDNTEGLPRGAYMIGIPRGDHQWCEKCETDHDADTSEPTRWLTSTIGEVYPNHYLHEGSFLSAADGLIGRLSDVDDALYAAAQARSGAEGPQRNDAVIVAAANYHAARHRFYPWCYSD